MTGRPRLLDLKLDADIREKLSGRSIYLGNNGYAYFSTFATGPVTVHSFVMGGTKHGMHIDHINGNKLDNRKLNLRFVSPQANQVNRKKLSRANTTGVRGVVHRPGTKNPWIAQITVNRKTLYLGSHSSLDSAIEARRRAEVFHFGEECPSA